MSAYNDYIKITNTLDKYDKYSFLIFLTNVESDIANKIY